jgi:two-component system sensor histidine kinase BaeS
MSEQEPWERQGHRWAERPWPHGGRWHGPGPHWQPGSHWQPGPHFQPWMRENWHARRRSFLLRFLGIFVLMLLLLTGGMAALTHLFTRLFEGSGHAAVPVWLSSCGLALALPLLALAVGARVFRRFALPLADIMEAADAVASGNFNVQVQERGTHEFQRLAASFNRMTEELARTDQQRRNLTADVAHELRTPLHIIQGNLEGILDGVYQPTREHIEATLEETRQLARLVDDLRTLSLAESGQLPLVRELVDVHDLLADVATSFSGQAEESGVELRVASCKLPVGDSAGPASLQIEGDAGRLDQVLSNLVGNALRHTPRGGCVTLAAEAVDGGVQITVADTGVGIAPADLPFIFDRFWRGDRARTHTQGTGSGLGLSIANQLVKAHGGEIQVTSEPGQGTTFAIFLPRAG